MVYKFGLLCKIVIQFTLSFIKSQFFKKYELHFYLVFK